MELLLFKLQINLKLLEFCFQSFEEINGMLQIITLGFAFSPHIPGNNDPDKKWKKNQLPTS